MTSESCHSRVEKLFISLDQASTRQPWSNSTIDELFQRTRILGKENPILFICPFVIENNAQTIKRIWRSTFQKASLYFPYKTNSIDSVIEVVSRNGLGAEVCGLAELEKAIRCGVAPGRILLGGPAKSQEFLLAGLNHGCGIVVDSFEEISRIIGFKEKNLIGPDNRYVLRMQADLLDGDRSVFGIPASDILDAHSRLLKSGLGRKTGLHFHLGLYAVCGNLFKKNLNKLKNILDSFYQKDFDFEVNVGSGFWPPNWGNNMSLAINRAAKTCDLVRSVFSEFLECPNVSFASEPGESVVGQSGIMVGTVYSTKLSSMKEGFLISNCGVNVADNGRKTLQNVIFENSEQQVEYVLKGPLCAEEDIIAKTLGPRNLKYGDLFAISHMGAYAFSKKYEWSDKGLHLEIFE